MQQAGDPAGVFAVVGLGAPAPQQGVQLAGGFGGLLEEDRQQLVVDVVRGGGLGDGRRLGCAGLRRGLVEDRERGVGGTPGARRRRAVPSPAPASGAA